MKLFKFARPAWLVLQDAITVLFRALGLHVFISAFRYLRHLAIGKGYDEPTKIAIRKSRTTALVRALIHVVPISVAIWEIIINWNTYYLGTKVRNQAYYQFGAKVHEIAAQASLAAIVFSYVRYEISLGQGLPFGALFSGLQISQASYLWSMEFWGLVRSKSLPIRRRISMALVVAVAITLAATVGPSSAILLIPRLEYWPAGATDIWLNATSQDLWPDRLADPLNTLLSPQALNVRRTNGTLVSTGCRVSDPLVLESNCPSSGWQGIQTYLTLTNSLLPLRYQLQYSTSPSVPFVQVTGACSLRQLLINAQSSLEDGPGYDTPLAVASTQQAAVADALSTTGILWNTALQNVTTKGHGSVLDQLDAVHSITTGYYQPYTIASCEHDIFFGLGDQKSVAFPLPPGTPAQFLNTSDFEDTLDNGFGPAHALNFPGITRSELLDTPGLPDEYRLRWVELPGNPFNGTAIGAVVLLPRAIDNTTQSVLMCNLAAGRGESRLNMSTFGGGAQTVLSENSLQDPAQILKGTLAQTAPITELGAIGAENAFVLPYFPQRLVTVTEEWAQYLNPSLANVNTTLFHHLMDSHLIEVDIAISAKIILSSLLANGLARIGSTSQLQGTPRTIVGSDGSEDLDGNYWFSGKGSAFIVDPVESKDWVKFRVYSTFEGFAYNTRGVPPKVAISFLLAYCVFALAHILYAGITGISSTCWDSIGEVTALAVNSTPSTLLRNTCAGITELSIFKIPVRVLAVRDGENIDGEHLELVFGELDEKSIQHQIIKQNRVYGTMPIFSAEKQKTL